jgi:HAE1 family hydrophobic/amphiphilic exporter-1
MWGFGRSLNVVSLAGISFAVGMLVDNAIVVLENIDRHRQMGKGPFEASYDGAREVWGAVFASTATTVAVFLPVIFIEEEAGQLFKDIAIAITFAILISLAVSVSAIPSITNQFYRLAGKKSKRKRLGGPFRCPVGAGVLALSRLSVSRWYTRIITVVALTGAAVITVVALMPKAEYLPQGNRNLILNIMIPPPGYSLAKRETIGHYIFKSTRPYYDEEDKDGVPRIKNIFYVSADRITLFGAISRHETRAREMMPMLNRVMNSIPGVFGVSIQAGIFQTGLGRGRTVEVNIAGEEIDTIINASRTLFGTLSQKMPKAQVRPVPSIENSYPEANFIPDRSRVLANGMTEEDLGVYVDVLMDGRKIGEFKPEQQKKIDLVLRSSAGGIKTPEDIADSLIANGIGNLIRIRDVADLAYSQGMVQINHRERKRNITLQVTPPMETPLQAALETITTDIVAPLREGGSCPAQRSVWVAMPTSSVQPLPQFSGT